MGLYNGDLRDTVKPLISIDEYEPKCGKPEEIIVIGFYVVDKKPATDLNDFLQRTALDIIDVDVSPNPNSKGVYLVFVEVKRDSLFYKLLDDLLTEVQNLTGTIEWNVSAYLDDGVYAYDDKTWEKYVITSQMNYMTRKEYEGKTNEKIPDDDVVESAHEFFSSVGFRNIEETDEFIKVYTNGTSVVMEKLFWSTEEKLIENDEFFKHPFTYADVPIGTKVMQVALGKPWEVFCHNGNTLIVNPYTKKTLYAKIV